MTSAVRRADWLTQERARAYGLMLAGGGLILVAGFAALYVAAAIGDPNGHSYSCDFNAFWSGARLAIGGHAGLAYDPATLKAVEALNAQPAPNGGYLPYLYPPIFLLLCLPLGLLPYLAALALFEAGGILACFAFMRAALPRAWPSLAIAAFPAALVNDVSTQNGCLTAALFFAATRWLETRPLVTGALLGLLSFKPHLAPCLPLAFLAARRWRALAAMAASALALAALSYAALGNEAWAGFLRALPMTRHVLDSANIWRTGVSVYAAARILHGGLTVGFAAQALAGLAAMAMVVRVCLSRPGPGPEMAVAVTAALLCTPYIMDYDLVCLAVPMVWIAQRGVCHGWRDWEKILLGALYIFPLAARTLNLAGVPLAPALIALLLVLLCRRIGRADAEAVQ